MILNIHKYVRLYKLNKLVNIEDELTKEVDSFLKYLEDSKLSKLSRNYLLYFDNSDILEIVVRDDKTALHIYDRYISSHIKRTSFMAISIACYIICENVITLGSVVEIETRMTRSEINYQYINDEYYKLKNLL